MFGTLFKCARTDNTCLSLFYPCWWCLKIFWYYLNRLDFSFCGMYLPRHRETNYSLIDNVSGWQLMSLNWNQQRAWNWCPIKSRALTHISLSHPGLQGLLILCWDTQAISKKIIMAYCHWSVSGPNFLLEVVLFRVTHLPTSSKNWIARMTSRLFPVILADLFFKQLRRSNWKKLITLQSIFQKVWSIHLHRKWNRFTPFNFYRDYFYCYLFFWSRTSFT